MTIIVFLIDNTASMSQKSYVGVSYLDFARQFVESFLKKFDELEMSEPTIVNSLKSKARQRDVTFAKIDRYMLMGFDEYPRNVKAGWKENQSQFNEQLRNLRPTGRSQFAEALFNAIRFINLNRVQSGIENFGYGRYPSYIEPVVFIAIVDATSDSARKNFLQNNRFPKLPAPGSELTEEPYRWDHKLFVVYVNLPGHPPQRLVQPAPFSNERKQIESVVEKMNGRAYDLSSHKVTSAVIDSILQRMQQAGVFVKFDRFGPPSNVLMTNNGGDETKPPDNWKSQIILINKLITKERPGAIGGSQSNWPIPEAFWPDQAMNTLPSRKVYPELTFRCDPAEPVANTNVGFDTYELEPCALTQALIERKNPNECWQVFVANSHRSQGIGYPFGYLKASSKLQTVNLFIFPYNYPLLFAIIEEVKDQRIARTPEFRQKVERYFANVPPYYISPLRKALKNMAIPHQFLDERLQAPIPYSTNLINQLKRWREPGKEEFENACTQVANFINPAHPDATKVFNIICGVHQLPMAEVVRHNQENQGSPSKIGLLRNYQPLQPLFKDCKIAVSTTRYPKNPSSKFRNPYDIERGDIVDQVEKMRVNLDLQFNNSSIAVLEGGLPGQKLKLQHAEDLHSLPVNKMGDYQEYIKRFASIGMGPMREFETQEAKPHAFGNPFKLDNKKSTRVDEVGEADASTNSPISGGTSNKGEKREEHLRRWERQLSVSRENSPELEEPDPKRSRAQDPINLRLDNEDSNTLSICEIPTPTLNDVPSPITDNIEIIKPQKSKKELKSSTDKVKKNGQPSNSKNGNSDVIIPIAEKSQDKVEMLETSNATKTDTTKYRKRRAQLDSSNSSSSASSEEECRKSSGKSNGKSLTMLSESEPLKNVDFKRRQYPQTSLTSAEDPPTLNKEEMIRLKFHIVRAIRHKDNKIRYDPGKECFRLINDLSWREQFECLDYAQDQANKFGLAPLASLISAELKKIHKFIRTPASNKLNGATHPKFF